jgi:hypothetical protein
MVFASSVSSTLSPANSRGAARLVRSHPICTGAAGALVALVVWLALGATAARADVATFQYSSAYQYFIVPTGVTSLHFDVVGGAGGDGAGSQGGGTGGPGGAVIGDLPVMPGQTLTLWAGGAGQSDGGAGYGNPSHNDFEGGSGGIANGGGVGAGNGGGGGAASYILVNGKTVAVAGGGGGGAGSGPFLFGADTSGGSGSGGGYHKSQYEPGSSSYGDTEGGSGPVGQTFEYGGVQDTTSSDNGGAGGDADPIQLSGGGGGGGGGYYVCTAFATPYCFSGGGGGLGGTNSLGGGGGAGGNSFADPSASNVSYGRGSFTPSTAGQITLSYGAPSVTSVTSSTATSYPGQSVTFHAFVDPSDGGGTVSFTSDGAAISGCSNLPFASGGGGDWVANCTTTSLAAGTHTITALYSGDGAYAGSSASTTESVYQSATSTSLTASPSSTTVGTTVTLTANVYSSDGGGTLSFTRNGSTFPECRSATLVAVSGHYQAMCTLAWSVPGSYTISAEYSGDARYGASSASTTVTVAAVAPTVTSISPNVGPTSGGGDGVQINGTHLDGASKVMFGTTEADVTLVSGSVIVADVPAHAAGVVDVTVTTPSGTSAVTSTDRYTYDAVPTVSSITPASGDQDTVVTINGTGFVAASEVKFGNVAAQSSTLVSATQLKATVPAGSGTVDTTVTTPGGVSATSSADRFAYVKPSVSSAPSTGPVAGGQNVTTHGTKPPAELSAVELGAKRFASNGTKLRLTVSQAARIRVLITQTVKGHKVTKRTLTFSARAGANAFKLRLSRLAKGAYAATITAQNANGKSRAIKLRFTIT